MRCVICKSGEVKPGTTTFTVERDQMTLVLKEVPAGVCQQCGEAYFDEATTRRIEEIAEAAERRGTQVGPGLRRGVTPEQAHALPARFQPLRGQARVRRKG
jgi:YgiT-type zinc finger domain-containing protein